ncbi:MAG TPA: alkylmercury lyase [Acidiferrobacteraceae bacterium]|nr:alkylmercury lyase [Acidiferrobacteraceae bacterium]
MHPANQTKPSKLIKTRHKPTDIVEISRRIVEAFPIMDEMEQRLALGLYGLLAKGVAVAHTTLSQDLELDLAAVEKILKKWPGLFHDDDDKIIGFWGLSIVETSHQLMINGQTVYAWCAWDTLFIPHLLQTDAAVSSHCPIRNSRISLTVTPQGVSAVTPKEAVVSFLIPSDEELNENITANFCHFVYFFSVQEAAETWIDSHPGTFMLSPQEAFSLGKSVNLARYTRTLA